MPRARVLGLAALLAIPFGSAAAGRASTPSLIVFSADREPQLSYEIFRLDPEGHAVNLSRSPNEDLQPLVSPDGKEVAFLSFRSSAIGQAPRLFEVRIDGTHVRNLRPSLPFGDQFAWQPHGERLAAISVNSYGSPDALWIFRGSHVPRHVRFHTGPSPAQLSWSPDGHVLLVWSNFALRAFTPAGRRLWVRESNSHSPFGATSWSSQGMLAVTTLRRLWVYDQKGNKRFEVRATVARVHVSAPSWSPNGGLVAFTAGRVVEVRKAGGQLVLRRELPPLHPHRPNLVVWAGNHRLVAGLPNPGLHKGVDLRTGRLWNASGIWFEPRSADGKLMIVTPRAGAGFAVGVEPMGGGRTKLYGKLPPCRPEGPPASYLQFAGHGRSIVYESVCPQPPSKLYSMAPDGTDLHEISAIEPNAGQPVLSPDRTQIAYTWGPSAGSLSGTEIRVANLDGTDARVLASPPSNCVDTSPTWSPDGKTILYSEGATYIEDCPGPSGTGFELYTVPAAGGAPHDLGIAGGNPSWGPTRIAYYTALGLTTANPDGSDPVMVAQLFGASAWSPDGRLAYTTFDPSATVVTSSTQVHLPFVQLISLAWSPDGTRFVVTAQKTATEPIDVYTVRTDGTDPVRLTSGYNARGADWR